MNWLPVVNRELRVAARKRSTFWLRIAAALTALVVGSAFMLLSMLQGIRPFEIGSVLFAVLTWMCLGAGLSAGLFFTSDCLSEEKREGTLGLLFLTDLRGYDVALGKLLATSLRGFYALLAVLPVLAITLMMGGVAGPQFWKSALALVNALFFSLAVGMAVSAVSRDSQKAMMGTLLALLLLAVGGPVADMAIAGTRQRSFAPLWSLASPGYVLTEAGALIGTHYWSALATTQLLGWAMLALAAVLVPHTWQERKKAGARNNQGWSYAWRYGGQRRRWRLRRKLIGSQPVAWLVCRERWQSLALWAVTLLVVGGFIAGVMGNSDRDVWMLWNYVGGLFALVLYLWAASQACRFSVEARRSGLLELLLATPLSERQIVAGQWRGLGRMFGWPILLLLGAQLSAATLSQFAFQHLATRAATFTSTVVTNQNGTVSSQTGGVSITIGPSGAAGTNAPPPRRSLIPSGSNPWQIGAGLAAALAAALSTAANLLALGWFGMWMGMTSRSANLATLKTILFVQIIPWFVITFGGGLVTVMLMSGLLFRGMSGGGANPFNSIFWWPVLSAVLGGAAVVAKDIGFIVWSRNKLHSSFREQAGRSLGQPQFVALPPLPAVVAPPPVIAAPQ